MALAALNAAHPELQEALTYALRHVAALGPARCADPVAEVAAKLAEFAARRAVAAGGGDAAGVRLAESGDDNGAAAEAPTSPGDADADAEEDAAAASRQRASAARGRRSVVFSEPVKLDADWTPKVHAKSDAEAGELADVLAGNILFGGTPVDIRRLIVGAMERRAFSPGDVIIKQGDPGDFYYVLTGGTADVTIGGRVVLAVTKGMGVGELALLYDAPRAATVTATSQVAAWALDRTTFKQVMMGATMRKRELYGAFLRGVPLFSTLSDDEVHTVADALQPVSVAAGEAVVVQGTPAADRFYIVEAGELAATQAGVAGEVCGRLGPGCYFGERALITDEPRAATVTAVTDSSCLAMDRAAFLRLLGPVTDVLSRNMELYARYSSALPPPRPPTDAAGDAPN